MPADYDSMIIEELARLTQHEKAALYKHIRRDIIANIPGRKPASIAQQRYDKIKPCSASPCNMMPISKHKCYNIKCVGYNPA